MLTGQTFVLGDYNSSQKLQLTKLVQQLQGTISYSVTKKVYSARIFFNPLALTFVIHFNQTSFLVTTKAEYERDTLRISTAKKYKVFIVSDEFLTSASASDGICAGLLF